MAKPEDFSLVRGGPSYRMAERLGLGHPSVARRMLKVCLLIIITWVPLLLLSVAAGNAFGHQVRLDSEPRSRSRRSSPSWPS